MAAQPEATAVKAPGKHFSIAEEMIKGTFWQSICKIASYLERDCQANKHRVLYSPWSNLPLDGRTPQSPIMTSNEVLPDCEPQASMALTTSYPSIT